MYTGFLEYKTSDNFVRVRTVSYSEHDLAEFASTICEEKKKKRVTFGIPSTPDWSSFNSYHCRHRENNYTAGKRGTECVFSKFWETCLCNNTLKIPYFWERPKKICIIKVSWQESIMLSPVLIAAPTTENNFLSSFTLLIQCSLSNLTQPWRTETVMSIMVARYICSQI